MPTVTAPPIKSAGPFRPTRHGRLTALLSLATLSFTLLKAAEPGPGTLVLGSLQCTACHAASPAQAAWIFPKTAPLLAQAGTRASAEWLRHFLASPQQTMPGTTMPDILRGNAEAAEALTHYLVSLAPPEFQRVTPDKAAAARGESLYHRIGCVACHDPQKGTPQNAPATVAVPLPRMAEKWAFDGLRRFLLDPLASRPSGRMPAMHLSEGEASDLAHYLLRETRVPAPVEAAFYRGRIRSFEAMETAEMERTAPVAEISLNGLTRERSSGVRFTTWLRVEEAGKYTFFLNAKGACRFFLDGDRVMGEESFESGTEDEKESRRLDVGLHEIRVDYVQRASTPPLLTLEWEGPGVPRAPIPASRLSSEREPAPAPAGFVVDEAKAGKGRALYASLQCAVCHEAKPSSAPALSAPALSALDLTRGCLAENSAAPLPDYQLAAPQREALRTALSALKQVDFPTPQESLAQTMGAFRCTACHVRDGRGRIANDTFFTSSVDDLGDEGRLPPRLDGVGDKLQPAWIKKVLEEGAGVRPSMNTRMPQFGAANVGHLAPVFIALDRGHEATPMTSPADPEETLREAGRKLTGTDGLSCIGCHRFNRQPAHALQVLDLLSIPERLNEDWFRRFLRDPERFHPGTRMPALWPNGRSPLPAVLDGDTARQHAALWAYFSQGAGAKFPEGLSRQNMELGVGGEAVVYRGKLWEAGFRAIATGYPGGLNAAFDAEEMRLALLWRGRFLNVSPHWSVQGMGQIRPLSPEPILLPHGAPFALLADTSTPWPTAGSKAAGMKFTGTQLDAMKRPTLLYRFGTLSVEDFMAPMEGGAKTGLRRTLKFGGETPHGLHLRVAVGRLSSAGQGSWRLNDSLTLTFAGSQKPFTRGQGEQAELIVPLENAGPGKSLEIEYAW